MTKALSDLAKNPIAISPLAKPPIGVICTSGTDLLTGVRVRPILFQRTFSMTPIRCCVTGSIRTPFASTEPPTEGYQRDAGFCLVRLSQTRFALLAIGESPV